MNLRFVKTATLLFLISTCSGCALLQSPAAPSRDICDGAELEPIIKQPTCIICPEALYSPLAQRANMEGDVTVQILVGADGFPLSVIVTEESGMNAGFEEAAQIAAMGSRFSSAETSNGCRVRALISKTYLFRINP